MRHSFISAAFVALISSVSAQTAGFDAISAPTQDQNIPAGSSFDIIWEPNGVTGTITIKLLQGATPSTLQVGPVVAASIDNTAGKYTYAVPSVSSFATYGFEIVLDSTASEASPTFQYSNPFHIVGGSSSASSSASASSSVTSSGMTTTVHLSTGPSYTSTVTPTTTSVSSSSIIVSTTALNTTSSVASTTTTLLLPSSVSNSTTLSTAAASFTSSPTPSSNISTSSPPAITIAANAAMSNIASGGMAMVVGILLALAL
ncbi:hypothetical protein D0Z07_2535 [Hyphodiscus hymeniophilus]|uniref:Yeast cell wall synthesis Kre9/Knh1-like N-terminal domain-containing protein n=1 Tax=Hyphodiscus hymeniophilus TaxID=353542 RepID=A0A9P6VMC2_9HELO|nr:hypothetical protein D0Z07_2535 [Hyphodiscus hymeniophilus]